MKFIPTNKNTIFGIVDDEDYDRTIFANSIWSCDDGYRLCARIKQSNGKYGKPLRLHYFILGMEKALKGFVVDHINRNPLDNRKENLRLVDYSQSSSNRETWLDRSHKAKYKNVYWHGATKQWHVLLTFRGIQYSGGYFKDEEKAALKANELILKVHQEFGNLNKL